MTAPTLSWPVDALRSALTPLLPGLVVEVAGQIDSTNSELMRRARAGDMAPVLLSLDATLRLASVDAERVVPLGDFFTGYRKTLLARDEVLVSVEIPR
ncbi:MAG TPA: FAD binding domain-containing protein, partial [Ottowia sp.]|nr:FAD binding domain-containing protein [Ottowia sp.]